MQLSCIAVLHGVYKSHHISLLVLINSSTPEESLAQPTMILAFCAKGFASVVSVYSLTFACIAH